MPLESDRKHLVLSHVAPSFTAPIADAIVIKSEGLFFLTARDGSVPRHGKHGLGLYYHDCRYLDAYELRLRGGAPRALVATASQGDRAVLELTNADASTKHGARARHDMLGIRWERALDGTHLTLTDTILLRNLRLRRTAHETAVDIVRVDGDLEVIVDRGTREKPSPERAAPAAPVSRTGS